ncbi:LacI family DNA-binding transcriptional regulator [Enterococcus casseliflavus]|uniref:HTH lacI-type domain-containing protein n=1 Tax=Enterococcus casseliflavus EC20 TaxID=565655 RepID=C9ABU1_ENTCA|nr:LacI family DNA-binding transcriptional regulator [Enterococcus casseliflavus]EEV40350.1 hypothetical protein ECBG_02619 [Enterococcus casseliflavus EC20]MDK4448660.1 LacI family transcriptional regulator [Enterococcus casseliflavus]MDO7869897.1 LacI family DNA-binding transcriptional regulator [Enterococcus casseliflavus]MDT2985928.1 LacI family DNA-binding transcriptional regulator [Enterococcus casseliflavus]MDV7751603.1 LacI family DNA-binding transcriptional regulator [Enterococcus cas
MKVRLKDIAKEVGVSIAAVSQVLNDKPIRITEEKKQQIKRLAAENNYTPNAAAKSLVLKKTNTIGLIIPDINNPFFANLAKVLEDLLRKQGYLLILVNSDDKADVEKELMQLLIDRNVDALIIALSTESYADEVQTKERLKKLSVPIVLVDRGIDNFEVDQVFYNNRHGGYIAACELIKKGHKKIGTMMNPDKNINCVYRYQGYLDALKEFGLQRKDSWHVVTKFQFEDAYEKADILLKNREVTGIVAGNDLIALGIMKRAKELGIKVPEDVSIVGYDNLVLNDLLEVSLTSVEQDVNDLGEKTVFALMNAISGQKPRYVQLTPRLIKKNSVSKRVSQ